jgi:hypothetical protein
VVLGCQDSGGRGLCLAAEDKGGGFDGEFHEQEWFGDEIAAAAEG